MPRSSTSGRSCLAGTSWLSLVFTVRWTTRLPAGVTKVLLAVFAVVPPSVTGPLAVVLTGPVNTSDGGDGWVLPLLFR